MSLTDVNDRQFGVDVATFPDLSNVIISNMDDGQKYKNKTQVLMNSNYPLSSISDNEVFFLFCFCFPSSHLLSQTLQRYILIHPSSKNRATDGKYPPVHNSSMTDCFNKLLLPARNLSFTQ